MKITFTITGPKLEAAYRQGLVPYGQHGRVVIWDDPDPRAIFELDRFRYGRTLRRILQKDPFEIRFDTDLEGVLDGCAGPRKHETGTWITPAMKDAYLDMASRGLVHTVEAWQDENLVGGLFVVTMGAACCGESMFHRVSNASNVCLIRLVDHLRDRGYHFLDIQYETEHLQRFHPTLLTRAEYHRRLRAAQEKNRSFLPDSSEGDPS